MDGIDLRKRRNVDRTKSIVDTTESDKDRHSLGDLCRAINVQRPTLMRRRKLTLNGNKQHLRHDSVGRRARV